MQELERELCLKLLKTLHLSVPERASLPNGHARFSVLVQAVGDALEQNGWFPFPLRPGSDLGEGVVLESRAGRVWVHEQHEVGVGRFGPIRSYAVSSVADGVRAYIDANHGSPIDGVQVAWRE
jgi:hypothetical protein